MTNSPNRGKGKHAAWLRDHVAYTGDGCLIWPFFRAPTGYGNLGFEGKARYAHRLMCEWAHGPAPSPEHEAAHSCGNGRGGCVHPGHLSWKTKAENMQDRIAHGTMPKAWWGKRGKITYAIVQQIRDGIPYGPPLIHWLSAKFGITPSNIRHIQQGRTWRKPPKFLEPTQLDAIRAAAGQRGDRDVAAEFGVSRSTVIRIWQGKAYTRPTDTNREVL